jgi:hypothetical protein
MFTDFCNQLEKHNNCQSNLSKWSADDADWERTRFVAYVTAQTQTTNPHDIIVFPWDSSTSTKQTTIISDEQKAKMIEKMKIQAAKLNKLVNN